MVKNHSHLSVAAAGAMNHPVNLSHLIAGRPTKSTATEFGDVFNPSTGEVIARVPLGNKVDVETAVQAAQRAFTTWGSMPAPKRAGILFRYRDLLEQNFETLARLVTRENGKTIDEARGDVRRGIEVVEFACGIAHLVKGESLPQVADQIDAVTLLEPLGVCAGISRSISPRWFRCGCIRSLSLAGTRLSSSLAKKCR